MSTNPRLALDRLIGALETFHQAAVSAQDPDAPSVVEAADMLADAYTVYDDVMFVQFGVEAPLDVYGDMEDVGYDGALDDVEFEDFDLDEEDEDDLDEDEDLDEGDEDDLEDVDEEEYEDADADFDFDDADEDEEGDQGEEGDEADEDDPDPDGASDRGEEGDGADEADGSGYE